jgi:hypothetical protein
MVDIVAIFTLQASRFASTQLNFAGMCKDHKPNLGSPVHSLL